MSPYMKETKTNFLILFCLFACFISYSAYNTSLTRDLNFINSFQETMKTERETKQKTHTSEEHLITASGPALGYTATITKSEKCIFCPALQ